LKITALALAQELVKLQELLRVSFPALLLEEGLCRGPGAFP
jgi:hypothetical protein